MKEMFEKGLNNQEIQKQMQFSISAIKQYRRKWKNGEMNGNDGQKKSLV